jgi:hypothetical protein
VKASPKHAVCCFKEHEVGACMAQHRGGTEVTNRFSWHTSNDAAYLSTLLYDWRVT